MRTVIISSLISCILIAHAAHGQAVSSLTFDHWYDPLAEVVAHLNPVIEGDSVALYYRLKTNHASPSKYLLKWERRDSYAQRQGTIIGAPDTTVLSQNWTTGRFAFAKPEKPWLLLVRLTNLTTGQYWSFIRQIEAHFPVNGYLEKKGFKQWDSFLSADDSYIIRGSGSGKPIHISYYRDNFPTPSPPFVVKEVKMDRFLFPDSTFSLTPGSAIGPFPREGLYLAQEDTLSEKGFSFYVKHSPYPKYNKLAELKGPLLFVTTQEENSALDKAGEDKAKFDRVILDITKDKDRARNFMRNYFKRIETANYYFTSL